MEPYTKGEILDILNTVYDRPNIEACLSVNPTLTEHERELLGRQIILRRDSTKELMEKVDWRKIPKYEFSITMPTAWYEEKAGWERLANKRTLKGIEDYLNELDAWIKDMATLYDAWKR